MEGKKWRRVQERRGGKRVEKPKETNEMLPDSHKAESR